MISKKSGLVSCFCILAFVLLLLDTGTCTELPSPYAIEKLSGQKAPDFTLKDLNGNEVSLSSFKGKVVILNFWGTWCPPCKDELPSLGRLNQLLKNRGLVILAVATDTSLSTVKDFIAENPVGLTVLFDGKQTVSKGLYKVFMHPTTFIIDKRGIIHKKYFSEQDWTKSEIVKEIEGLL
jgi:peroxiredoxin